MMRQLFHPYDFLTILQQNYYIMFLTISLEAGVLKLCGQDHKKEQSYIKGYLHIKNENTILNTVKKAFIIQSTTHSLNNIIASIEKGC